MGQARETRGIRHLQRIATNPALKVTAERQSDYALRTVNRSSAFFTDLTYVVGAIMAAGAVFGMVKLMYAAAGVRTREFATPRAIGYQALTLAVAVLLDCRSCSRWPAVRLRCRVAAVQRQARYADP
jgi:hypothetical protein